MFEIFSFFFPSVCFEYLRSSCMALDGFLWIYNPFLGIYFSDVNDANPFTVIFAVNERLSTKDVMYVCLLGLFTQK